MQLATRRSISNHFGKCSKFEQSLPKMVTSCTIWSRSAPSVRPRGRLVVQVSGGTLARIKQRRSGNQDQTSISEKRVDTIRGAGLNRPALFFAPGNIRYGIDAKTDRNRA